VQKTSFPVCVESPRPCIEADLTLKPVGRNEEVMVAPEGFSRQSVFVKPLPGNFLDPAGCTQAGLGKREIEVFFSHSSEGDLRRLS
jgi:hypothetical protein